MNKVQIEKSFSIPMPVLLLGAQVAGKDNFMTLGWCARANANPPMILCSVGNRHYTIQGILETKTFSVNLPSVDMLEKTDYCGIVSGAKTDKSNVFEVFYGTLKTAPMIKDCPICLECQLVQTIPLPTNTIFIGEIVGVYAEDRVVKEGKPDYLEIDPLLLTMPDKRYWTLGRYAGDAWSSGKKVIQSQALNALDPVP
jgi:flavin reductase (DIM6/NTAB) family NADH-FMN oxidoreductase RutF